MMAAGALGLVALPPFGTYFAEGYIHAALEERNQSWLVVIVWFSGAFTAGAILRLAARVFWGWGAPARKETDAPDHEERETSGPFGRTPPALWLPAAAALLLAFAPAAFPAGWRAVGPAASHQIATHGFASQVLALPAPAAGASASASMDILVPGLSLLAALLFAGLALAPQTTGALRRVFQVWRPLHAFQSGRVGDYVAWEVAGMALWGAFLIWQMR
jgi:multicomponent Na+:H+ antiporter subunit D